MPYRVINDQGTQFRSELFKNIGVICGFKVCTTTSYHPQCNGKIERIHRTLKAAIRAHNSVKWTQTLPTVLLGLRSDLRRDTNYTIAQIVYGQTIRLPGEFFETPKNVLDLDTFAEELQKQMDQLQPLKTRRQPSQKHFVHKDLHNNKHVFIRVDRVKKALKPPYDGPFPMAKKYDKYFTVKIKGKDINIGSVRPDDTIYCVSVVSFKSGAFSGLGEEGAFGIIDHMAVLLTITTIWSIESFNLAVASLMFFAALEASRNEMAVLCSMVALKALGRPFAFESFYCNCEVT
ncbi:transposon Tf2-9 polyprotein [Trichonephila clavipes]|nr:transposon Tf2-9 polyprotein [Trichonephila clavipes]